MTAIENKIEKCKSIMNVLVSIKDINNIPCNRYYIVLRIYQKLVKENNEFLNSIVKPQAEISKQKCYFDLPELKVTSTTYERAKRNLEKQIDSRFNNRVTI